MYYAILISSALFIAGQFVFLKLYQRERGETAYSALIFSMLVGFFQAVFAFVGNGFRAGINPFSVIMAAAFSVCVITCNTLGIKVMHLGKVSVYTLFMMLGGMIVPFFYGVIFLNEELKVPYIAAIVLLILSLIIPAFEKNGSMIKSSKIFYPLCCVLFFVNGAVSTVSKAHQIDTRAVGTLDYIILIGLCEFIIALILMLFVKRDISPLKIIKLKKPVIFGAGFALVNFVASVAQFYSAKSVDASVLYPIITGGTIVFSAILSLVFFKEKINKYNFASILIAFCATLLFLL